jgi:hypothetical protein
LALVYAFSMNNEQLSPEDFSALVEVSADERQMQNFSSPDMEESEGEDEDWDDGSGQWDQAESDYEARMEGWMDSRGEE